LSNGHEYPKLCLLSFQLTSQIAQSALLVALQDMLARAPNLEEVQFKSFEFSDPELFADIAHVI